MIKLAAKLIIFAPLIASIINGLFALTISKNNAARVAMFFSSLSALCAFYIFVHSGIGQHVVYIRLVDWLNIGTINISWAIYIDQLSSIMILLVTSVSMVVHIYSLGYMANDKSLPRFLAYLSLFTFFMLALVSSDNFLQLFFGWEGVGLCSYLLIGYYSYKESANNAAIKAFITNRVADFALIIGLALIYYNFGTLNFDGVFSGAQEFAKYKVNIAGAEFLLLDIICLLLFIGAMGKSAQLGFHVWLPDAMEGPTPVSALIHAATMVTAGVFLLVRCSYIFEYSPAVLYFVTIIGAVTCLFAALIAICQSDIKKIIAYSTCSQLGYMFFACGVSAYQAAIFHLVTHGFFKALLFLSAGSVIHSVHEQNIFKMGGLRKKMPITYTNFWLGSLAIIGVYPFAGFYSKDMILEGAYMAGGAGLFAFWLGIIAAILTAIYSMKIIILTFHGKSNLSAEQLKGTHESPAIMNVPLFLLCFGALFAGMLGYYILNIGNPFGFFAGTIFNLEIGHGGHHPPIFIILLPLLVGLGGMYIGYLLYRETLYKKIGTSLAPLYSLLNNKFYIDELFEVILVLPTRMLTKIAGFFDSEVIDRFGPNGCSFTARFCSRVMCHLQTGYVFNYALYIILALVICISVFVYSALPLATRGV